MSNEKRAAGNILYSLISLDEFKSILGVDDREDKLCRFCLVAATLSIEQYCKRKFLKKSHTETIEFFGDLFLPLREYPVKKILAAFLIRNEGREIRNEELGIRNRGKANNREQAPTELAKAMSNGIIVEPELYRVIPDCGADMDVPFSIEFSPAVARLGCKAVKVIYAGGYAPNKIPADLQAACLELAAWNLNRYRGRRVGMTGNIIGAGVQGEHFEMSMPENVRHLLESYKRKVI